MKAGEVKVGQLVEVWDIHSIPSIFKYTGVVKSVDPDGHTSPSAMVECTVTNTASNGNHFEGGRTYGGWYLHNLKLVEDLKPKITCCTCDIKQLLWGKTGCTCGWIEIERSQAGK
jgi:hypothetical protein